jgi:hypothetical protein
MVKVSLFLAIISMAVCCQKGKVDDNKMKSLIDTVIQRYDKEDFAQFKNITIVVKSANPLFVVYGLKQGNYPFYFITYYLNSNKPSDINRALLEKMKVKDYFTDSEINNFIMLSKKYDFAHLFVDSSNNVIINPFVINDPPMLLRLDKFSIEKQITMGYLYKHYKDNWYVLNRLKI